MISIGTQPRGRIKKVGGVPIETMFIVIQFLPIFPIRSVYRIGTGEQKREGVPFLAYAETQSIHGFQLKKLDKLSAFYGYLRGISGAIAFMGTIWIAILCLIFFQGRPLLPIDQETQIFGVVFAIGCSTGILTYVLPKVSDREYLVRALSSEFVGYCIDPARILPECARDIEAFTQGTVDRDSERSVLVAELVSVRCRIAVSDRATARQWELRTDDLLQQIASISRG